MDNTRKYIMPNLIYVSREKSKVSPHHFKAGALNTLVSTKPNIYISSIN